MKLTVLAVLSLFTFTISAQRPQGKGAPRDWSKMPKNGRVIGKVMDASLNEPLSFATISLIHGKDSTIVSGGLANEKGWFDIEGLTYGPWKMTISFIGYEDKVLEPFIINPRSLTVDLGVISVAASSKALDEVSIVAESSQVAIKIDKKVIDVSKDLTNAGGSAEDVLQNMPGVEVDMDGNISLRGNTNVTILIDGKPSALTGASRQAIVNQIPADAIEKVEIITNPSAKYDPDGMSGIINIILKKNKLKGFSGNVAANYGFDEQYNGNASVNYRNKKWNLFSNYAYRKNERFKVSLTERELYLEDTTKLVQTTDADQGIRKRESHNFGAGAEYNLSPKSVLGISGTYNLNHSTNNTEVDYSDFDVANTLIDLFQRNNGDNSDNSSYGLNLSYDQSFKKEGQKLSSFLNYSLNDGLSISNYEELYFNLDGTLDNATLPFYQDQNNDSKVNNIVYQLDYEQPLKKGKLESGVKYTGRIIDQDMSVFEDTTGIQDLQLVDEMSNHFIYNEQVMAAYGIYSNSFKKFEYQIGLRAEAALTDSELKTTGEVFENNYNALYPSAYVTYKHNVKSSYNLSYSRRVNRPGYRSLNPFRDISDPFNIRVGNPFLNPEFIDSYEAGYIRYFEKGLVSFNAYYKKSHDEISRVKQVDSMGVSTLSWDNFSSEQNIGFEVNLSMSPTKWLRLNGSFNMYQNIVDASNLETTTDLSNTALIYFGRLNGTITANKKLSFQLSGFYRSRRNFAIGYMEPMLGMDFGARYSLIEKKLNINLRLKDAFDTRRFEIYTAEPTYQQHALRDRQSRFLFVGLDYRFGSMKASKKRRKGAPYGDYDDGGGMM